jgi:serine O-acetyltransferase
MSNNEIKKQMFEAYSSLPKEEISPVKPFLVFDFLNKTSALLLLDFYGLKNEKAFDNFFADVKEDYRKILSLSNAIDPITKLNDFLSSLPRLRKQLLDSIEAIKNGDPACDSANEIVQCYPGFKAILYYRIAHELYKASLLYPARLISEKAHALTGIDIHPGATIGDNFFIDHGTGIVIGETTIIGNNVKIFQGVTLGALSLSKGNLLRGQKRHPTVEDNVTIYSSAAIFGGDTVIGEHSTIGAVVYLTHSVPPYSIVIQENKEAKIISKRDKH